MQTNKIFPSASHEKGFTILEVLIAILVLGMALVGAAAMQTMAVEGANRANRQTDRTRGAETWLEELMARSFDAADISEDNAGITLNRLTELPSGPAHKITCRVLPDVPMENLITIQVHAEPANAATGRKKNKRITLSAVRPKAIERTLK